MTTIQPKDIILESALLSTMSHKQNFTLYVNSIDKKRLLPATSLLLTDYEKYFKLFPEHETVDFGQFQTQFTQNWHNKDLDQLDIEYYRDYVFPAIQKAEGTEHCLLGLLKKQTTEEISEVLNSEFSSDSIKQILEKYENKQQTIIIDNDPDIVTSENVDLEILDKDNGIPYFLPCLQAHLGGLIQGQFVVVSADSNTGKSAFMISQAVHAYQDYKNHKDRGPILYFNSEGTPADIFGRFWSNLYHKTMPGGMEEIVSNREDVRSTFNEEKFHNKFNVFQIGFNNLTYIRAKLQKYKPSLVIIDMLDVLADVEDAVTLKRLYDNIRRLSLEFCPIIGTTQSGNTSWFDKETGKEKTKRILTDKDVLGCKAKAAAAETMITIGKDPDRENMRYINIPKKKRGKATAITCQIVEEYSLYREIIF